MNNTILSEAKLKVDVLLGQYNQYIEMEEQIAKIKDDKFQKAVQLAKEQETSVSTVLSDKKLFIEEEKKEAEINEALLRLSDDMKFDDPVIWMMYKYLAYKGTNDEIRTIRDFFEHCSPEGYICTRRFTFMSAWLAEQGIDLHHNEIFSEDDTLDKFYESDIIISLVENEAFMSHWKTQEYFEKDGKTAKWEKDME